MNSHIPTPEQALEQLEQAAAFGRRAASISPAWLHFIAICAGGSAYPVIAHLSVVNGGTQGPALTIMFTWLALGVATIPLTARLTPIRRGFGKRWGIMIGLWTVLWAVTIFGNNLFSLGLNANIALSIAFAILALLGPTYEIVALKKTP